MRMEVPFPRTLSTATAAAVGGRPRGICPAESREKVRQVLGGDPSAGVGDFHLKGLVGAATPYGDGADG